ncbi:MAG TPA: adenosylcobinamide-GDP ribazoletransferase [Halanaerobiales bacterium]|nr:adenosylcobinamide-GDP ribazoletransferase [Halanaerobiales bacterium]
MNSFLIALQFITIIPVKKELDYREKNIAKSMLYYPLIGTIIGLFLVLVNIIGTIFLPDLVRDSLLLIFFVLFTGGIHFDGLADTFDGLFGGSNKKRILEIMGDSSIGVYGILAVVLVLILKLSLLAELPMSVRNLALITAPTISRCAMVWAVYLFPYAKKEGFGKAFKLYLTRNEAWLTAVYTVIVTLALFLFKGIIILVISALGIWLFGTFIVKKIEGLTGDNYGALNELMEVLVLFLIILLY